MGMDTSRTLKVCVVGCGDMGVKHAERWHALAQAEVVCVADVDPARAEQLAARFGAAAYRDAEEAVSRGDVDAVSVCIPTADHARVSIAAMERGKHVLCEKPIALDLEDAARMVDTAARRGVKLGVGLMREHSPVTEAVRNALSNEALGRPVLYAATDARQIRPKPAMHDAARNGGPVIDMLVHYAATWMTVFESRPVIVHAQGMTLASGRPELAAVSALAPDTAVVTVTHESGDVGTATLTWGLPPGVNPPAQPERIFAPTGFVELEFAPAHQWAKVMRERGVWEVLDDARVDMYAREITDFAEAILHDRRPRVTGRHGVDALRVALAAMTSLREGRAVAP